MTGEKSVVRAETSNDLGIELGLTAKLSVRWYRIGRWCVRHHLGFAGKLVQLLNRMVTGADIDLAADVSPNVLIPHTIGVVVGATSIIEEGVVIMPHVVLGARDHSMEGRRHPHICRNASIGAGAVLLGPIVIGEGARVGANAVVLNDVAPGATVLGIPARPISFTKEQEQ